MAWLLAGALALAVVAGLCASAETAFLRLARAGARDRARPGPNGYPPRLHAVLAEPRRYLSVLMVLRVGSETAAVVLATAALVQLLGNGWRTYLIALTAMAAVLYVVAGIWPVTLGSEYDRQLAGAAANLLTPLVRALGPLPRLLIAVGNALTPGRSREGGSASEEELRGLVDLLGESRVIEPGEREMIHSVFELGDTIVREVMVPRTDIVFVEHDKTVRQALSLALRSGFSRIPVVGENEDDVIGIAYLKDLVARSREHPDAETVENVESVMRQATFVPESKPADDLLSEMQARQIHVAIVIDEYGGTAGLVTIEDILEEIVGEIADEYDHERPGVEWLSGERARVTARLPVTDLEELFGVSIDAEDVETVGGLLAHALGRVPIAGSTATVAGLTLTAESVAGRRNRIDTVTVERAAPSAQAARPGRASTREAGVDGHS